MLGTWGEYKFIYLENLNSNWELIARGHSFQDYAEANCGFILCPALI